MDLLAERLLDHEPGVQKLALETVRHEIRTATSSMTSIPKPLKFMRPHYTKLKEAFEKLTDADNKVRHVACIGPHPRGSARLRTSLQCLA